jgi:nucleotide-binding universal stress UspA family protein
MYEVLLGIDEDTDRALAQANAVKELPGAETIHATLLHDFTKNPSGASVNQLGSVRRAQEVLEDAGIEVTLREASGEPAATIIEEADDIDADLVVLAGRKRTPTGKVLFGSVTQAVILGTNRPVMVAAVEKEE